MNRSRSIHIHQMFVYFGVFCVFRFARCSLKACTAQNTAAMQARRKLPAGRLVLSSCNMFNLEDWAQKRVYIFFLIQTYIHILLLYVVLLRPHLRHLL